MSNPQPNPRIIFLYSAIKREINNAITALIPFTHIPQITLDPRIKGATAAAGFAIKKRYSANTSKK